MTQPQPPDTDWRNQEIKIASSLYQGAAGIRLIVVTVIIGFVLFQIDIGYLINLYTTIIGVLITIFVLDRRAERREALRAEADLKSRLIREMGSQVNEVAIRAVEELRAKGWLSDGSLVGKYFHKANLQEANLSGANLQNSVLSFAYLQGANFNGANLENTNLNRARLIKALLDNANLKKANLKNAYMQEASLGGSHLQDANLKSANLQCAELDSANMQRANLWHTNLQQTDLDYVDLRGANLKNANLASAELNQSTILPDGEHWTHGIDLTRFIDPNHPQFWRSDDPASPAYGGKTGG